MIACTFVICMTIFLVEKDFIVGNTLTMGADLMSFIFAWGYLAILFGINEN